MSWPPEDPELARYRGPHLAVDVALLSVSHGDAVPEMLGFVVHRRGVGTHGAGEWALIGRMVRERETLAEAVRSALEDKCGILGITPRQLFVSDDPTRDSRGWVMSVAHIATEPWSRMAPVLLGRNDLAFVPISRTREASFTLPDDQAHLPYEQDSIVAEAIARLREMYVDRPDPGRFLPDEFTVYQLRRVHETVLGRDLDKDVFRRQMLPYLEPTGRVSERTMGRPARLFRRQG